MPAAGQLRRFPTVVRSFPGRRYRPRPPVGRGAAAVAKVATTWATRRLSISTTRSSQPPTRPPRPRSGCARSASKRRPPRVTYSPSGMSMPSARARRRCSSGRRSASACRRPGRCRARRPRRTRRAGRPTSGSEEVLHREHAGHPAVLVDDHGEGPAVLAHVGQRLEHAAATRARDRAGAPCARCRAGSGRWRPSARRSAAESVPAGRGRCR